MRDHLKVTSIVVTHDMRSARRVGNHLLMLHERKIYANAAPETFFNATDPIIRQFVDGVADAQGSCAGQFNRLIPPRHHPIA
jgi:phospholipid/cholesterol/gamma-HCH transport system ATP-binding protein